jgi:hypothetical protein
MKLFSIKSFLFSSSHIAITNSNLLKVNLDKIPESTPTVTQQHSLGIAGMSNSSSSSSANNLSAVNPNVSKIASPLAVPISNSGSQSTSRDETESNSTLAGRICRRVVENILAGVSSRNEDDFLFRIDVNSSEEFLQSRLVLSELEATCARFKDNLHNLNSKY